MQWEDKIFTNVQTTAGNPTKYMQDYDLLLLKDDEECCNKGVIRQIKSWYPDVKDIWDKTDKDNEIKYIGNSLNKEVNGKDIQKRRYFYTMPYNKIFNGYEKEERNSSYTDREK